MVLILSRRVFESVDEILKLFERARKRYILLLPVADFGLKGDVVDQLIDSLEVCRLDVVIDPPIDIHNMRIVKARVG